MQMQPNFFFMHTKMKCECLNLKLVAMFFIKSKSFGDNLSNSCVLNNAEILLFFKFRHFQDTDSVKYYFFFLWFIWCVYYIVTLDRISISILL